MVKFFIGVDATYALTAATQIYGTYNIQNVTILIFILVSNVGLGEIE